MRIPEIRDELAVRAENLLKQADDLDEKAKDLEEHASCLREEAYRLEVYIKELRRRPAIKRAPRRSKSLTPELTKEIKAFVALHPRMSNAAIGRRFGVDGGRVTDAMRGKRK